MAEKKPSFQPIAFTLTIVAALLRLVPHPPNFAPVGSVALFGGARLRGWQAYLVPVLAMLVTDPILSHMSGFPAYSWASLVIYSCFLINVALGRIFLSRSSNPARIAGIALAGSVQFYLITNFFVWLGDAALYPRSVSGLIECYIAAVPFFGWTVLGDIFYTAVLFGAYALLSRHVASEKAVAA